MNAPLAAPPAHHFAAVIRASDATDATIKRRFTAASIALQKVFAERHGESNTRTAQALQELEQEWSETETLSLKERSGRALLIIMRLGNCGLRVQQILAESVAPEQEDPRRLILPPGYES